MIDDETTWYLGTVGYDNYKMAKYSDLTTNTLTSENTTAKVGILRTGELNFGQFDFNSNNTSYLSLTPFNSNYIRGLAYYCYANNGYEVTFPLAIKPAMNLKSNVIITGGDGTKNNPFTLALG